MLEIFAALTLVAATPSTECLAAASRLTEFLVAEAKGTRHEEQIRRAAERAGGMDKRVAEVASTMDADKCAFLITAPDSTLRALAISMLPERNGK